MGQATKGGQSDWNVELEPDGDFYWRRRCRIFSGRSLLFAFGDYSFGLLPICSTLGILEALGHSCVGLGVLGLLGWT